MKKAILLFFTVVVCFTISGRAQTISNEYYHAGANLNDDFSWSIDSVGYLHYTLIDAGSTDPNYESAVLVTQETAPYTTYVNTIQPYGGNISGCVYIGFGDQFLIVGHGSGMNSGPNQYETAWWDFEVNFDDL